MAKANLTELIDWIKSDTLNRFELYDVDKERDIVKCISYAELIANNDSALAYFEKLANRGIKTVQIVKKRKNGSSYVREGCGLNFALSTDGNVAASGGSAYGGAATPQPSNYGLASPGSGNTSNMFGLGLPEIMTMRSQSDRFQDMKEDRDKLQQEKELLVADNKRLENENLKHQLGLESKPSAIDKLVEGIASNPEALPQIIASFKGVPGLQAPAELKPLLSDTKSLVVDMVSNNKQITDDHVMAAYHVLMESLKGNNSFIESYIKLLQEHKIIDNGSDNNSNG